MLDVLMVLGVIGMGYVGVFSAQSSSIGKGNSDLKASHRKKIILVLILSLALMFIGFIFKNVI